MDIYIQQCSVQLGIDLTHWTLNAETLTFVERNGQS